jgi:acyl-CoA dehydrogenase
VGVEAYSTENPISAILQDVLCFPVYDGGNMGVRRRQLHELLKQDDYDALAIRDGRASRFASSAVEEKVDALV